MQKRLTRTGATLTAEGISPSVIYDNPDAATIYVMSQKVKKAFEEWFKYADIQDIQKASTHRKPRTKDKARELLEGRLDIAKKPKLEKVLEAIDDGDLVKAWRFLMD